MPSLRRLLQILVLAWSTLSPPHLAIAGNDTLTVYKNPSCGCCGKWIEHMQRNGFNVVPHNVDNIAPIRMRHRVPEALGSCHTAVIGNYAIEGHVPADTVKRLLKQRPKNVIGLSAPGMPQGSPGMESATPQRYDIVAFDANGRSWVYERR